MAQNVVVNGTEYDGVSTVAMPTASGGTASFIDASNVVTSVNGENGDVTLTTDKVPSTTTNRYVPQVPTSNPETSFLNGNGTFIPIAVGGASSVANIFLSNTASTINTSYKTLNYLPDSSSTAISVTCTNSADVLSATYLYSAPIGVTIIDSGVWKSTFYALASSTAGTTRLKFVCFVRAADGTETDLFTGYTTNISSTSYAT